MTAITGLPSERPSGGPGLPAAGLTRHVPDLRADRRAARVERVGDRLTRAFAVFVFAFLFLPIVVVVVYKHIPKARRCESCFLSNLEIESCLNFPFSRQVKGSFDT